jgi:hypothetical protein
MTKDDSNHLCRHPCLRGDPRNEATPEHLGVERGQNIAEVIVRGRPILEASEALEQGQLQPAKLGDIGNRLRPGDHGQQTQQQNLTERIFDLSGLPRITQPLEIAEKHNRFVERFPLDGRTFHSYPPIGESVDC